ncbi:hypothetical protein BOBR111200_24755 [Bordetella bronchialis]
MTPWGFYTPGPASPPPFPGQLADPARPRRPPFGLRFASFAVSAAEKRDYEDIFLGCQIKLRFAKSRFTCRCAESNSEGIRDSRSAQRFRTRFELPPRAWSIPTSLLPASPMLQLELSIIARIGTPPKRRPGPPRLPASGLCFRSPIPGPALASSRASRPRRATWRPPSRDAAAGREFDRSPIPGTPDPARPRSRYSASSVVSLIFCRAKLDRMSITAGCCMSVSMAKREKWARSSTWMRNR